MTFRLFLRTVGSRPVRTLVLSLGFGFGIAVMAALLGVGEVILEQAKASALEGGGDLVLRGVTGEIRNARFVLDSVLGRPPLGEFVAAASPSRTRVLYLVGRPGSPAVRVRGGIPSLERALGDPETADQQVWRDTPEDRRWSDPPPGDILRAMDRFHPMPRGTPWQDSWAEWLYFNGRSEDGRTAFYLTFLAGPPETPPDGPPRRGAGVRLQLERDGQTRAWSEGAEEGAEGWLASAPDLALGGNSVRLRGRTYEITLDLPPEERGGPRLQGTIRLESPPGRSLPPLELKGRNRWVSGYTVPVLSGPLQVRMEVGGEELRFTGTGYHDHNWGFWRGVTWQWGQVAREDQALSIVYGRVHPPEDAADPGRVPGFLGVLGPDGPRAFSTSVSIEERDGPAGHPESLTIRATGPDLDLTLDLRVTRAVSSALTGPWVSARTPEDEAPRFFQMRALYRVEGTVGGEAVAFSAEGACETFR